MISKKLTLSLLLIALLSSAVYLFRYNVPNKIYWDEHYNIPNAYRYINNIMYMHGHPPLGKLFIALGEVLVNPNKEIDMSYVLDKRRIDDVPKGFSFKGVRLFPTIFAMLSPLLFFMILYQIYRKELYALLCSFLYLFDNAMVLHFRAAMLDGIEMFFILLALCYFLYILAQRTIRSLNYFVLALFVGCAISVKINAAVLLLLFVYLAIKEYIIEAKKVRYSTRVLTAFFTRVFLSILGISLIISLCYYIHFSLGRNIAKGKTYHASKEYLAILEKGESSRLSHFPLMLRNTLKRGSDKTGFNPLDQVSIIIKGRDGSHPLCWPFGHKSIRYRWKRLVKSSWYLYLQANPVSWTAGFLAYLISIIVTARTLIADKKTLHENFQLQVMLCFILLYTGYMLSTLGVQRVLYLYHYFIALIFSFILLYSLFAMLAKKTNKTKITLLSLIIIIALSCAAFLFFSPFTYFLKLSEVEFQMRNCFPWWELDSVLQVMY